MGLVLIVIVLPFLAAAAVAGVGIGAVCALTMNVEGREKKKTVRWVFGIAIVLLCAYLLEKGVFSPTLPAWH